MTASNTATLANNLPRGSPVGTQESSLGLPRSNTSGSGPSPKNQSQTDRTTGEKVVQTEVVFGSGAHKDAVTLTRKRQSTWPPHSRGSRHSAAARRHSDQCD